MYRFTLLGGHLPHSLSPQIHRRLLELAGLAGEYTLTETGDLPPDGWMEALLRLDGFNVTIPHKEAVIPFLTALDPTAAAIGAVNTVHKGVGYNTDILGFTAALEQIGQGLAGQRVCILGAGGTARMMAAAALSAGCPVVVAARSSGMARAEALCRELSCLGVNGATARVQELGTLRGGYELLCNATPVGMFPKADACPVGREALDGVEGIFDAIYNPTPTVLVKTARDMGIPAICGMSMLVGQAAAAESIWTGAQFSPAQLAALTAEMEAFF